MEHSPEPWTPDGGVEVILSASDPANPWVASAAWLEIQGGAERCKANRARILACVNGCQGLRQQRLAALPPGALAALLGRALNVMLDEADFALLVELIAAPVDPVPQ